RDDLAEVTVTPLGRRRAGKVKEALNRLLQPGDLAVDDPQIFETERLAVLGAQGNLHEHFHSRQRVAYLVGDAGRQLADGGQLLGPQHVALMLLLSLGYLLDP